MEPWRTAIINVSEQDFWIRGYDIGSLMQKQTFAGTIFLLHQGRLPTEGESRLLDAILISASDHGPGCSFCGDRAAGLLGQSSVVVLGRSPRECLRSAMSTAGREWHAWRLSRQA